MLQLNYIRENAADVIARLAVKNFAGAEEAVKSIIDKDEERRRTQNILDGILAQGNNLAKEIGDMFKSGKAAEANTLKAKTAELKEEGKKLDEQLSAVEKELNDMLVRLPNLPHTSVPKGKTAEDNENIYEYGEKPQLGENALPHWELTSKYDIIDFELGNKLTGAGFPVYKGKGARLQRALINFFLERATAAGYLEKSATHYGK